MQIGRTNGFGKMNQLLLFETTFEKTWLELYREVLSSSRWKRLRERLKAKAGYRCSVCKNTESKYVTSSRLELHHVTYDRLGCEDDLDLQVVCKPCHAQQDAIRAAVNRKKFLERSADALYEAQFDGWAKKVFGEQYYLCTWAHMQAHMRDSFDEWKERKDSES